MCYTASLVYQWDMTVSLGPGFQTLSWVSQFLLQGPLEEQVIEDYIILLSLIFLLFLTQSLLGDNFFPFQILFPVQVFMSRLPL